VRERPAKYLFISSLDRPIIADRMRYAVQFPQRVAAALSLGSQVRKEVKQERAELLPGKTGVEVTPTTTTTCEEARPSRKST